jgi:hypothetical protein
MATIQSLTSLNLSQINEDNGGNSLDSSSNFDDSLLRDIKGQVGEDYEKVLDKLGVIPDSPPRQRKEDEGKERVIEVSRGLFVEKSPMRDSYGNSFIDDEGASVKLVRLKTDILNRNTTNFR